ncbi:MAG TPA: hypothetical protein VF584_16865 [Longimicrobium sp.]|jgi:hypothetical protein
MSGDDSVWEAGEVAAALEHYLGLGEVTAEALEERLLGAGVLERAPVREGADEAARFQVLALAAQDLWLAERFRGRSADVAHFGRLRGRFFAALRVLGEHGAALERAGLVILRSDQPWIAPLLAEALASAPVHVDAQGPMLVMMKPEEK